MKLLGRLLYSVYWRPKPYKWIYLWTSRVWLESRHAAAHESWGRKLAKACKSEVLGCGYIKQQLWQEWRGEVDFGRGQGESGPSRKVIGRPRQASPSSVTPYHSVAKSCCWEGEGGVWALSVRYVPRIRRYASWMTSLGPRCT